MTDAIFLHRKEAGELLADRLAKFKSDNPIVLAVPRGGIPVAYEISTFFDVPLIPLIVRKISAPNEAELAIGAIGEEGALILDTKIISAYHLNDQIHQIIKTEQLEVKRRLELYRDNRGLPQLTDKTAIIVDDGLATGFTGQVAIEIVKTQHPKKIIMAIPVCSDQTLQKLSNEVDEVICLESVTDLGAIGNYYYDFTQISDDEVMGYLKSANALKLTGLGTDTLESPEEEGERSLGGSMVDLEADDDTEKSAREAGIKTARAHR